MIKFQSTCPARGTTGGAMVEYTAALPISIHVPREGHDSHKRRQQRSGSHFNPRAPRGARPHWQAYTAPQSVYFNPRAPRGARLAPLNPVAKDRGISIHVPREGHDCTLLGTLTLQRYFNPRAPRGARPPRRQLIAQPKQFQSTCPARGTTKPLLTLTVMLVDFNPRAPRGARH